MITTKEISERLAGAIQEMGSKLWLDSLEKFGALGPLWMRRHLEIEHTVPSPSGIEACRLQQYWYAKKREQDIPHPTAYRRQAAMGVLSELWWLTVFEVAGFGVFTPNLPYECGPHMKAHPDALFDEDPSSDPYGYVLELKHLTGFTYKRHLEGYGGLKTVNPNYEAQVQLYMHAAGTAHALFLASPSDPKLLEDVMRQRKKYGEGYELPLVHLEWVKHYEQRVQQLLRRAEMIAEDLRSDEPPPREFTGAAFIAGRKSWPCGYCAFQPSCIKMYGWGGKS